MTERERRAAAEGRLTARPLSDPPETGARGLHPLGLSERRDGLLYAPATAHPAQPLPLIVALHGAGGDALGALAPLLPHAEARGLLLLAPESGAATWDLIEGVYGPDVAFIDRALAQVFGRYPVDARRVVLEGFSDGASYALSLGLGNGDLFTHVLAFAPGFIAPAATLGLPRVFVMHGTGDRVLPIDRCSRVIVPQLRRSGYGVEYLEFEGGHTVPGELVGRALGWLDDLG
ncbi:alpha/beta hydrolase [Deinococcus hopiensis]|uniref:Phospholipase/carboxylesterase n=1 Tax=Deinococcus hopiensis KR-140 TaxID=695939 RepID=A0A1W1VRF6_9DEIO|nr:hypothetical protein [Deinococcus hopiensis]SMB95810.1 phospholipase/carboxylesterase [Deinococcus hopiensis KR-140]